MMISGDESVTITVGGLTVINFRYRDLRSQLSLEEDCNIFAAGVRVTSAELEIVSAHSIPETYGCVSEETWKWFLEPDVERADAERIAAGSLNCCKQQLTIE